MGNQISFTVTEGEAWRQTVGAMIPIYIEPRGKADAITIIVFTIVYCINFLAVVYMLWHRNYPPIKAKSVKVMAMMMVLMAIWFIGDLQGNGHVPLINTAMTNCKGFGIWMRLLLGVCGVFSLMTLRAYGLYRIFHLHQTYHSWALYLVLGVYWLCILIFGVVSQVLPGRITTQYTPLIDICNVHLHYQTALYAFMCTNVAVVIGFHWMIRNIKSSFNETREMVATCIIVLAHIVYSTILSYAPLKYPYPFVQNLRIIYTVLSHIGVNSMWWLVMSVPLYNCMFSRQRYLVHWITKLRDDGLQKEYDVSLDAIAAATTYAGSVMDSTMGRHETGLLYAKGTIYSGKDADTITRPHM
ncbi:hypothetical protein LPJ66_002279, partial [Kickxella alabastrina]